MKSFVQEGGSLSVLAPYDVASGAGFMVGFLFLVAGNTALSGTAVEGMPEGVFTLKAASADTGSVGAKMYWDNSAKQLTTTSAANTLIGVLTVAKTGGQLTATVYVDGAIR